MAARIMAGMALAAGATIRPARPHAPSPVELAAHLAFLGQLSNPLWLQTES
jgi:DNA polymerase-3 subunit epsilon